MQDIKATMIFQLAGLLMAISSSIIICQKSSNIHLDSQIAKTPKRSVDRAQGGSGYSCWKGDLSA